LLKYFYVLADGGVDAAWKEVESQASKFIDSADDDLLAQELAAFKSFTIPQTREVAEQLGPYLYLLRGRAILERTNIGEVTEPSESLGRAISDLEKVREPRGDILASGGAPQERDRGAEQAKKVLKQAVDVADTDPEAHVNLLRIELILAQSDTEGGSARERLELLEPEYLSLIQKFPSSASAHTAVAVFYRRWDVKNIDKAIQAAQKAVELDRENVTYGLNLPNLHYLNQYSKLLKWPRKHLHYLRRRMNRARDRLCTGGTDSCCMIFLQIAMSTWPLIRKEPAEAHGRRQRGGSQKLSKLCTKLGSFSGAARICM
jgi:tetratricopeptide (TPR) repeat protein